MLQIKNISKKYKTGDLVQIALDNVSLNLRDNEFVAVLGPSGSGKTTLLNIIGGLDRYDNGDLVINGISTKKYRDRDWDTYRNHTIGFVFQSYNLIPHQTILRNVELALTISGVSGKKRKQMALDALDKVGLKDQAHKRPNQMSGGQMQRVAIARALVNNPDIVLADEPTGALDTKTSVQVMDLLKEVANDRLVVMVTHNSDLANTYANRIVQLKDGQIISDSNPFYPQDIIVNKKKKRKGKAKMGFLTALSLSFNNLLTKKGRTFLTAFAGSIGIIGIALILALSQGFQNYIDKIQEDTLSSYPLTIQSETADTTSAILSMVSDRKENQPTSDDELIERQYMTTMFSSIGTNDLKTFKKYIEDNQDEVDQYAYYIKYSYSISPTIYTIDTQDKLIKINPSSLLNSMYSSSSVSIISSLSSSSGMGIFSEMSDDIDSYKDQYEVLAGRWPSTYNEMIIVLSEPNSISDLLLYSIGLRDYSELKEIISSLMSDGEVDINNEPLRMTYQDLLDIDMRLIHPTDTYRYNEKYDIYEDMSDDNEYMLKKYEQALKLKVVGVVCSKEAGSTNALSTGVNYTKGLVDYIRKQAAASTIVKKQMDNKEVDVFSGVRFDEENESDEPKLNFEDMISIDKDVLSKAFKLNVDESSFTDAIDQDDIMNAAKDVASNLPSTASSLMPTVTGIYQSVSSSLISAYESTARIVIATGCYDDGGNIVSGYYASGCPIVDGYDYVDKSTLSASGITNIKVVDGYYTESITTAGAAMKDALIDTIVSNLPGNVTDYVTVNSLKTVMSNSFDNYITYITPLATMTLIDVFVLPTAPYTNAVSSALNDALSSNGSAILTDACSLAAYSLSAQAIGTQLASSMSSLSSLFSGDIMSIDTNKFAEAFKFDMSQDELSRLMETMLSGSDEKSYSTNLIDLGYQDTDNPTSISFYFKDFESKENFLAFLDKYNENADEERQISYTDITGILMSSVKTIVDSVTYVLIAFCSISLIVSSIMIAVITLISVMERTKEIGILRAMGASKHNVSSIFNAETFIIGFLSGLIGVGFTYAVIPPINKLIHNLTNNYDINAVLPRNYALILVLISVVLTIVAGIIPSRKAAKQDPVIALRTE